MSKKRKAGKEAPAKSAVMLILPWVLVTALTAGLIVNYYENRLARLQEKLNNLEDARNLRQELLRPDKPQRLLPREAPPEIEKAETKTAPPAKNIMESAAAVSAENTAAETETAARLELPPVAEKPGEEVSTARKLQAEEPPLPREEPAAPSGIGERTTVYPEAASQGCVLVSESRARRVMIDLGKRDGVEPGARVTLWDNGRYAGEARVTAVFAQMSAAEVVSAARRGIRVGDTVREVKRKLPGAELQAD